MSAIDWFQTINQLVTSLDIVMASSARLANFPVELMEQPMYQQFWLRSWFGGGRDALEEPKGNELHVDCSLRSPDLLFHDTVE